MKFVILKGLIEQLQEFEKKYSGNLPVLLADKDSPNVICPVVDSFVIDIVNKSTEESQKKVLISNLVNDINV